MSGKVIQVLLTDAEEWPQHRFNGEQLKNPFPGMPIKIFAKPLDPATSLAICDTDYVWEATQESTELMYRMAGRALPTRRLALCRHQIQIGD